MSEQPKTLGGDLMVGADEIAEFLFGDRSSRSRRKVYRIAETRALRLFKMGGQIAGMKSTLRGEIAERESGAGSTSEAA